MTKKKRIFYIILACLSLLLAFITFVVCSSLMDTELKSKYSTITTYESDYYSKKFWWVFLIFIPLSIFSLFAGIKYKDRFVVSTAFVMLLVTPSISLSMLNLSTQYSTSTEYLEIIEDNFDCKFPNGTTILINNDMSPYSDKDNDINIIGEGVIRLSAPLGIENNLQWHDGIDETAQKYMPTLFNFKVRSSKNFTYNVIDENRIVFLAYYEEESLAYFSIVEVIE